MEDTWRLFKSAFMSVESDRDVKGNVAFLLTPQDEC
jgi:hypothetical protein